MDKQLEAELTAIATAAAERAVQPLVESQRALDKEIAAMKQVLDKQEQALDRLEQGINKIDPQGVIRR